MAFGLNGLFHLIAIHPLWMTSEENLTPGHNYLATIPPRRSLIRSLFPQDIIKNITTPPGLLIKSSFVPPGHKLMR